VTILTLNRPETLDVPGPGLMAELLSALRASTADERTRAIVLTGTGRAFSAGGDIGFGEVLAGGPAHAQGAIGRGRALGIPLLGERSDARGPSTGGSSGVASPIRTCQKKRMRSPGSWAMRRRRRCTIHAC